MKRRKALFAQLSQIRQLLKKFAIVLLFVASFVLMLLNKTDTVFIEKTSSVAMDIVTPVVDLIVLPAKAIAKIYESILEVKNSIAQNKKLVEENKELIIIKNKLVALEIENKVLANMINYTAPPQESYITARVVAEEGDAFSHALIVYTGSNDKINKGQVVMADKGLVGRIDKIGNLYSKILLVTDINSKIPIQIERNRVRGMLVGDNTPLAKVIFTPIEAELEVGDKVITSGVAGVFPAGLPVGRVVSIDKNVIKVKLWNNLESLEYVKIVDYEM